MGTMAWGMIAFPPTGNGRKSLFLLPLPVKSGGRKGQESVRDPSAPGYCSMDTNCTTVSWKLWEEAEAKSLLLWLIDLTLGLLSRICHAKSDLLSASSRVLFWQHFLKLDFKCILGVLSESFIMRVQLFRLKRQCRWYAPIDSVSSAIPIPTSFSQELVGTEKRSPIYFAHWLTGSVPPESGKKISRGSLRIIPLGSACLWAAKLTWPALLLPCFSQTHFLLKILWALCDLDAFSPKCPTTALSVLHHQTQQRQSPTLTIHFC